MAEAESLWDMQPDAGASSKEVEGTE